MVSFFTLAICLALRSASDSSCTTFFLFLSGWAFRSSSLPNLPSASFLPPSPSAFSPTFRRFSSLSWAMLMSTFSRRLSTLRCSMLPAGSHANCETTYSEATVKNVAMNVLTSVPSIDIARFRPMLSRGGGTNWNCSETLPNSRLPQSPGATCA